MTGPVARDALRAVADQRVGIGRVAEIDSSIFDALVVEHGTARARLKRKVLKSLPCRMAFHVILPRQGKVAVPACGN